MEKVTCKASLTAAALLVLMLGFAPVAGVASHFEPTTGYVQDWSPERGYVIVDGVRYQLAPDVRLVDQLGYPIPLDQLRVGAHVGLYEQDGVVVDIVWMRDDP